MSSPRTCPQCLPSRPCASCHGRPNVVGARAGACNDLSHPDLSPERTCSRFHQGHVCWTRWLKCSLAGSTSLLSRLMRASRGAGRLHIQSATVQTTSWYVCSEQGLWVPCNRCGVTPEQPVCRCMSPFLQTLVPLIWGWPIDIASELQNSSRCVLLSISCVPCAQTAPDRSAVDLQEAQHKGKLLLHFCGPQPQAKANAAVLVGLLIPDRRTGGKLLCAQG